jgi:hypothetical protein
MPVNQCALCLKSVPKFVNSHIVPRSFYEEFRSKEMAGISTIGQRQIYKQGLYGKFLCDQCEKKFDAIDSQAFEIFKTKKWHQELGRGEKQGFFVITDAYLQIDKIHLFALSLLWRASCSLRSEFRVISLGIYKEKLRLIFSSQNDFSILARSTGICFFEYRSLNVTNDASFDFYKLKLKSKKNLFVSTYGKFNCHVFGFPYGEIYIRLGGENPKQGYFDIQTDFGLFKAVQWSCNLTNERPHLSFVQGERGQNLVGQIKPNSVIIK